MIVGSSCCSPALLKRTAASRSPPQRLPRPSVDRNDKRVWRGCSANRPVMWSHSTESMQSMSVGCLPRAERPTLSMPTSWCALAELLSVSLRQILTTCRYSLPPSNSSWSDSPGLAWSLNEPTTRDPPFRARRIRRRRARYHASRRELRRFGHRRGWASAASGNVAMCFNGASGATRSAGVTNRSCGCTDPTVVSRPWLWRGQSRCCDEHSLEVHDERAAEVVNRRSDAVEQPLLDVGFEGGVVAA